MPGGGVARERLQQGGVAVRQPPVVRVVRVSEHEHHAAAVAEMPRLLQPEVGVRVLQDGEQGVILREGDREFHRAPVEVGQERAAAARLRLVRVGVAVGRVIVETEPVHQFPVPVRGR
jgi:hypothetical protein